MRCIPCGGGGLQPELAHLNDCYPPSKALLASGPEYRPLSQDLSKLTYFATNKPSKLAHIGEALEKRVTKEATRSSAGYPKSRASLLISLAILRALLTECKRDIGLFAKSTLRIIDRSLDVRVYHDKSGSGSAETGNGRNSSKVDLEVTGRAAASFVAFTTYTDGALIGVDNTITNTYHSILRKLDAMATWTDDSEKAGTDMEQQSRTRLIALAALNGAATSDAMFTSNAQFPTQVELVLPPLLNNIFSGDVNSMAQLKLETAKIEMDASPSPFFSEFSARRPINDRRAPSLHAHVTGEKGPGNADVLSASVRSLQGLVAQCKVGQVTHILDAINTFLDKGRWQDVERCCWLAERLTAWISLQYRFVVPTRLIEVLVDSRDSPISSKHTSILAMVFAILTSATSLVGLGVTDLLNNLTALIIRRVRVNTTDSLLPALVQCVASLGTHIYYADQINDIVEELSIRMAELQTSDPSRTEIIRILVHCIMGVMKTAQTADDNAASRQAFSAGINDAKNDAKLNDHGSSNTTHPPTIVQTSADKGKGPQIGTPLETPRHHTSRRNPISPEVWQETLPLLCEADYGVRSAYSRALLLFLETEVPRTGIPQSQKSRSKPLPNEIAAYRFCSALHAAIYTMVMSSCLGAGSADSVEASPHIVPTSEGTTRPAQQADGENGEPALAATSGAGAARGEKGVSFNLTEPSPSSSAPPSNGGTTTPTKPRRGSRRVSLPLNRVHSNYTLPSFSAVATPYDFAAAVTILNQIHTIIPGPALMTGIPMLIALDRDAGAELIRRPGDGRQGAWVLERKRAIREMVAITWRRIGERWGVGTVEELADSSLYSLPEPFLIPVLHAWPEDLPLLPGPEEPISFPPHHLEGESSSASRPLIDPEVVCSAVANSHKVQSASGRDAVWLMRRLGGKWSVESAVKDSVERFSSANVRPADDPHYDVASVLMSLNNGSFTSFGGRQPQAKAIDVEDLREALGGRVDISPSATASIVSSADDHHTNTHGQGNGYLNGLSNGGTSGAANSNAGKRRTQADVKEVLKDIFKDKKRAAGLSASRAATGNGSGFTESGSGSGSVRSATASGGEKANGAANLSVSSTNAPGSLGSFSSPVDGAKSGTNTTMPDGNAETSFSVPAPTTTSSDLGVKSNGNGGKSRLAEIEAGAAPAGSYEIAGIQLGRPVVT